jgi:hypothetical protein
MKISCQCRGKSAFWTVLDLSVNNKKGSAPQISAAQMALI